MTLFSNSKEGFDVSSNLKSADSSITVFGEIKTAVSPKLLEQMAPWIKRVKSLREGVAFAVICPAMSPQSQAYCIKNGIDFLDLAGNISINIPGKFTLQRLGMRNKERTESAATPSMINVFSGRSSRVLRVLLEKPKFWTQSAIAREMEAETARVLEGFQNQQLTFTVSIGALSKVIATLEEQLWIRRQGSAILIPEPKRLLMDWAEKYKERYRWRLRSSFQSTNPFGETLSSINDGLKSLIKGIYAFTGAAGAREAPYIDIDKVDVFLSPNKDDAKLRQLRPGPLVLSKAQIYLSLRSRRLYVCEVRWFDSHGIENTDLLGPVRSRRPGFETSGLPVIERNRAWLEGSMIPEPHLTYLSELLAALGPAADDFVVAGAQAMKFTVARARGTQDFDFILNVMGLLLRPWDFLESSVGGNYF